MALHPTIRVDGYKLSGPMLSILRHLNGMSPDALAFAGTLDKVGSNWARARLERAKMIEPVWTGWDKWRPQYRIADAGRVVLAQGTDARSGETACGLDPKGDGPVPEGHAPNISRSVVPTAEDRG